MTDDTYNPDAIDGDGDGIVQEGTEFERPAGTQLEGFDADATDGDGDGMVQDGTKFERPAKEEPAVLVADEPVAAPEPEPVVITGKSTGGSNEEQVLAPVENGAIGAVKKKKAAPKPKAKPAPVVAANEKVAVFANRNLVWQGLGKLTKGYNFVTADAAEKWLTIGGVRKAEPTEIKTNLG